MVLKTLDFCVFEVYSRTGVPYYREDGNDVDQSRIQQRKRLIDHEVPNEDDFDYDDEQWPLRMTSSVRRYQTDVRTEGGHPRSDVQTSPKRGKRTDYAERETAIPPRRTATQAKMPAIPVDRRRPGREVAPLERETRDLEIASGHGYRPHWLLFVGLAMLIMVMGWVVFSAAANWWQVTQDDWRYGRPRTFQTDAVVGQGDLAANPSHFIALNLNRRIEIIEFPGGDPTKARIFLGPTLIGDGQDLAAVTLTFKDVNGDGKPDMIVSVEDSHFVFVNENGTFRPARPGETIHL